MDCYTPEIGNPYPDRGWKEITDFEYLVPLELYRAAEALPAREGSDADYVVRRPYTVGFRLDGKLRRIIVPQGMLTDLASVPRIARSIVGRVGPHLEASIVHDYLYIAWQDMDGRGPRSGDRDFADELFKVSMKAAKVRFLQRQIIHRSVRAFGRGAYRRPNPGCRYVVIPGPQDGGVADEAA